MVELRSIAYSIETSIQNRFVLAYYEIHELESLNLYTWIFLYTYNRKLFNKDQYSFDTITILTLLAIWWWFDPFWLKTLTWIRSKSISREMGLTFHMKWFIKGRRVQKRHTFCPSGDVAVFHKVLYSHMDFTLETMLPLSSLFVT